MTFQTSEQVQIELEVMPGESNSHITREIVQNFLSQCQIPLKRGSPDLDPHFRQECLNVLIDDYFKSSASVTLENLPSLVSSFDPYLTLGVRMASTGYAHLTHTPTRVYVALFTALLVCLDDIFPKNVEVMCGFNERFIQNEPQGEPILDAVAGLLRSTSKYFTMLSSNMIVTSALNFVTSLSLDQGLQSIKLAEHSRNFAHLCRNMSGIPEAFAAFVFPSEVPFTAYIQCFPDLYTYANYVNDVLSFYKEDIAGETENLVSILAQTQPKSSKYQVVQQLADEAAAANANIRDILADQKVLLDAYDAFRIGFVQFHIDSPRYMLADLVTIPFIES